MTAQPSTSRGIVCFTVLGTPVPQGSMISQRGRVRHSSSERLTTWREVVAAACLENMRSSRYFEQIWRPWDGPIKLILSFTYKPRTKAQSEQPKYTSPDIDKLCRAVLDALSGVLYEDDRQVVQLEAHKYYGQWVSVWDGGCKETSLSVNAMRLAR